MSNRVDEIASDVQFILQALAEMDDRMRKLEDVSGEKGNGQFLKKIDLIALREFSF